MSAPETQHERYVTDSVPLSQMLPPPRILPFPEKKVQPFRKEESDKEDTLEEVSAIKKPVAKTGKQTKGRGKLAKGKAADQNIPAVPSSSDPLALSSSTSKPRATKSLVVKMSLGKDPSSSAPPKVSTIKAATRSTAVTTGSVDPPDDISPPASHKRPMADVPESEANKRQAPPFDKPSAGAPQVHPQQINPLLSNFAPDELLDSIENWVQKYNRLSAPAPPRTAKDQLAGYAAQSEDERMHAIDNLICECLEDENFYQLVEDVEGAWKRIGLGF